MSSCDVGGCYQFLYMVWQVLSLVEHSHHLLDKTHLALCMKRLFTLSTEDSELCAAEVVAQDQRFQVVFSLLSRRTRLAICCVRSSHGPVVKAMHFHRVKLGSSSAVNHTGHSWYQEGLPARIAPMRRKSSTLYMACCTSLCKRECTMLESPL